DIRGVSIPGRGPRRGSPKHRPAAAELVGGSRELEDGSVVGAGGRRASQAAGMVRAVRREPADGVLVLRGARLGEAARGDAGLGRESAVQWLQRQFRWISGGSGREPDAAID